MTGFLASQLRHRAGRALTLALGIVVAAVAFVLLTGSAATSAIHVRETLKTNFRGAYDILVRPQGSFTPLERARGLVRDNYLSGIYGGITLRQYHEIAHLPGVEIAAPIANIGTTLVDSRFAVPLDEFLRGGRDELFRVRFSWLGQRGLSRYPGADEYLYATRRRFTPGPGMTSVVNDPGRRAIAQVCDGYDDTRPIVYRPFVPVNSTFFFCAGSNRGALGDSRVFAPQALKRARVYFDFMLPVTVAAIDPAAETRLLGLSRAVVAGRYLTDADRPRVKKDHWGSPWLRIPVLAASRSFVGEQLEAAIERLVVPARTDLPGMLGAGACGANGDPAQMHCGFIPGSSTSTPIEPGPPGRRHTTAYRFLTALRGVQIAKRTFTAQRMYTAALSRTNLVVAYWRNAPARYRRLGEATLEPIPATNAEETWANHFTTSTGYFDQPTDNLDVQFRKLSETAAQEGGLTRGLYSQARTPTLVALGRFDPLRLRGFSPLSRVPLETYYPPSLVAADAPTRERLQSGPLLPSQNIGDYEQQPPLLLTNLRSLPPFFSGRRFEEISPRQRRAPISVIRIRVKGVTGPNALSETRIRTVAQLVHDRTGLDVDITAGSSPTPITIRLPRGKFGRPPLTLREGWVEKGASVSYLRALDRKDLAVFALVLVVCAVFLLNGALASVRARRSEIGVLLTLGWSRRAIFRAVLGELALVGLVAGAAGTGIAALLVRAFALAVPLTRTLYVLPIALGLAVLAGLPPAWEASRANPLDALRPPVHARRRSRSVTSLRALALVNLTRLPLRTALGAAGLALGVAALTVLVAIERSFQGTLVGTLLGNAVSVQVRGADFVAVGLTIALAAVSAADVLYLNLRERAAEFITLETTGWSGAQLGRLVLLEAAALGLLAALVGTAIGIAVGGLLLGVPLGPLAVAALIAGAGALVAAVLASLGPIGQLLHLPAPPVLAAE